MSTVSDPERVVYRLRRRPPATATPAATTRKMFGNNPRMWLPIPEAIDYYNYHMIGPDEADQLRNYYFTQRPHNKNWKPIWHFLVDMTVVDAYILSRFGHPTTARREELQKAFRKQLVAQLFQASGTKRVVSAATTPAHDVATVLLLSPSRHELVKGRKRHCKTCSHFGDSCFVDN